MDMQPGQMAYDRAITVFSPDGRLFQVEYAREAVRRGSSTAGIIFKDGVILVAEKRTSSKLADARFIEKLSEIDTHVGCATAGLMADARVLVDYARTASQVNKISYNEKIPIDVLIKKICDYEQQYTQYGGVRPFGTSLIVGGVDDEGPHVFETDPSGSYSAYRATSIGGNRAAVMEFFEEKYRDGMSLDDAIMLGLEGITKASDDSQALLNVEIAIIEKDHPYRELSKDEVEKYINKKGK
ncbi:MAG: archaeal proteasome endopeptidase complex subunit alpha [Candidatus Thermoplasmatota archaeon]|jgi:proteasome alpha subunit|nr:archaeal proteasome endopeptidase complex subunit alpha [Candidatus Thermoplasmatota archaeon]MCL5963299.1 archaeal proteasome endopeptidase complex subunit alpha [Candidatus Thermoplasmatota archaeon]